MTYSPNVFRVFLLQNHLKLVPFGSALENGVFEQPARKIRDRSTVSKNKGQVNSFAPLPYATGLVSVGIRFLKKGAGGTGQQFRDW
jgi:hypothetical protein